MSLLGDCVAVWEKLLDFEYKIIIGRKMRQSEINIAFAKHEMHHLLGFQYLKDIAALNVSRLTVFNNIKSGKITQELIESSKFFPKIKSRMEFFPHLEEILDSNKTVFKFNERSNQFSVIEFDYLLKNQIAAKNIFVFLAKKKSKANQYFCRSFFTEENIDYSRGQSSWTLLFKSKKNVLSEEESVLYKNPHFNI